MPLAGGYEQLLVAFYRYYDIDHHSVRFLRRLGTISVANNANISSLVSMLIWLPMFESRRGKVHFFSFVILRYLRMLPVIIGYQLIVFAFNPFGHGPLSNYVHQNVSHNCLHNGWREIFLISNTLNERESCNVTGWYLSADFQLYILSFAIISIINRSPKRGIITGLIVCIIGMVIHGFFVDYHSLPDILSDTWPSHIVQEEVCSCPLCHICLHRRHI